MHDTSPLGQYIDACESSINATFSASHSIDFSCAFFNVFSEEKWNQD